MYTSADETSLHRIYQFKHESRERERKKQNVAYEMISSWVSIVCVTEFVYGTQAKCHIVEVEMEFNWIRVAEANYICRREWRKKTNSQWLWHNCVIMAKYHYILIRCFVVVDVAATAAVDSYIYIYVNDMLWLLCYARLQHCIQHLCAICDSTMQRDSHCPSLNSRQTIQRKTIQKLISFRVFFFLQNGKNVQHGFLMDFSSIFSQKLLFSDCKTRTK